MGTNLNTLVCYVAGSFLLIKIQRVNEGMNKSKFNLDLAATVDCKKRMVETTKSSGQRDVKWYKMIVFFFTVGLTQIGWKKI